MSEIDLIAVVGPTASGKSSVSIKIAKRLNTEIINCDSMQVYKEMNIGTAKIKPNEMDGIKHHLLSIRNVKEDYSVAAFSVDATKAIEEIKAKGKIPIVVGGTGLYIDSVVNGIAFADEDTEHLKIKYNDILLDKGADYLHSLLQEVDKQSAKDIHKNNTKRVLRALVATEYKGRPFSQQREENKGKNTKYNALYIGLDLDNRELLYSRINSRVDEMMKEGLVSEVKALYGERLSETASAAIGYKELFMHFNGEIPFEGAVELIKQRSRNYAKRQMTWFRKNKHINWLNPQSISFEDDLERILREYKL